MGANRIEERISKVEYERLAAFRYALRRFLRAAELNARATGITSQQYQALLAIRGFPDRDYVSIGELAERLQLSHNSIVELVDRMETQELITRFAGVSDKRQVCVTLTPRGRHSLETVAMANREQLRHLAPNLISALQSMLEANKAPLSEENSGEMHENPA